MRNCTLVCRSWYLRSSQALVRKVTICEKEPSLWKRNKSPLKLMAASIKASPWMTFALHSLEVSGVMDISALYAVVIELQNLQALSFNNALFLSTNEPSSSFVLRRLKHLNALSISDPHVHPPHIPIGRVPYNLEPLTWFERVEKLELHGSGWRIEPHFTPTVRTHVSTLRLSSMNSAEAVHTVLPILGHTVVTESMSDINAADPRGDRWGINLLAAIMPRYLAMFGKGVRTCTLSFDLWTSKEPDTPTSACLVCSDARADMNVSCTAMPSTNPRKLFGFSLAPNLQRVRLRFEIKAKDDARLRVLSETWKCSMNGLICQPTFAALELHFRVYTRSAEEASALLDTIEWSLLNKLVSAGRSDLPMIKIGFFWMGITPHETPLYRDRIRAAVSRKTRGRLSFAVGKRVR